jgi:hypothetical protein
MSREAMQMAIEALEDSNDVARMEFGDEDYYSEAINALRQALETGREWVGLTDEEIQDLIYVSQKIDASNSPWFDCLGFYRAIEAKLKEKNQ